MFPHRYTFAAVLCSCFALAAFAQSSAKPAEPIAIVAGQPLYEQDLLPLIQSQLAQLRTQEYELRSKYLDALINQKLAEAEAKKRDLTVPKLMEVEINSKVAEP